MPFSQPLPRILALIVGLFLLVLLIAAAVRLTNGERQVQKIQEKLFVAIEGKDWDDLAGLLHPDYEDRWQFEADTVVEAVTEVREHFLLVDIEAGPPATVALSKTDEGVRRAEVKHAITLDGKGSPISQEVVSRCRALKTPFIFQWEKTSWTPGSWKLRSVEQTELQIDASRWP